MDVKRCDGTMVGTSNYLRTPDNVHGMQFVQAIVSVSTSGHNYPRNADMCGSCLDKQIQQWQRNGWPKDIVSIYAVNNDKNLEDDPED